MVLYNKPNGRQGDSWFWNAFLTYLRISCLQKIMEYRDFIENKKLLFFLKKLSSEPFRRRKWQPSPVLLPGESQGQRSLVGCCPWGRTESYMTEVTQQQQQLEEDIAESWVVCEACGSWGKLAFQRTQDFHSEGHHCSTWWSPFSLLLLKLIKGWITGSYPSYHSEGKGETSSYAS